jgi:hypothetical protein
MHTPALLPAQCKTLLSPVLTDFSLILIFIHWSVLIRGSTNMYRQRAGGDVRNDWEQYIECDSQIVHPMLMQRETRIWPV